MAVIVQPQVELFATFTILM